MSAAAEAVARSGAHAGHEAPGMGYDYALLLACLGLGGFGLMMVLSASGIMAAKAYGNQYYFFYRQAIYFAAGLVAMLAVMRLPRRVWQQPVYLWLALSALLLTLTLAGPLSVQVNGARRWLRLGPLSFQPLETAKLALVFYLAYFFSGKQDKVKYFTIGVLPPFVMTGLFCGLLLLQPDFGGAMFLCGLLFFMSVAGGTRVVYLASAVVFGLGSAVMLVMHSPYRFRRFTAFLDPFKDAKDVGYQLAQSLIAFGSGGFTGEGLGAGKQKLFFLPEAHNDFLMAVVGEEIGFVGVSLVFVLIGIIIWRSFRVAIRQGDLRDRFTAYGMALILSMGCLANLAVVLGTVPPKGVPMPFLSYGGSQILSSFIALGVLLNLSRRDRGKA